MKETFAQFAFFNVWVLMVVAAKLFKSHPWHSGSPAFDKFYFEWGNDKRVRSRINAATFIMLSCIVIVMVALTIPQ